MAALSEGNYSLVLDYPLPGESAANSEHQKSAPLLQEPFANPNDNPDSIILYQNHYSSKNHSDDLDQSQSEEANPKSEQFLEVDMYTFSFQPKMFFRSLWISLSYTLGIIMPFLCFVWPFASNFFKNYQHYTDGFTLKFLGICGPIYSAMFAYMVVVKEIPVPSIAYLYHFQGMIIYSLASVAVGSYCNKKFLDILNSVRLHSKSLTETRFEVDDLSKVSLRRKRTKDELLDEQSYAIQQAISRLDIDISLHYMAFFAKTPQKLLRKLVNKEDFAHILEEKENKIFYNQQVQKPDLPKAITNFERLVFQYRYFTKPNKYDNEKAHIYPLAMDLLTNIKKTSAAFTLIGVLYASIIGLYFYTGISKLQKQESLEETISSITGLIFEFFYHFVPYLSLGFFTLQAFRIMSSKFFYMEELKELISTKKQRLDNIEQKAYPTMNILDFRSLKTWACLRKIFMHLHDEKLQGQILAVTIIMVTDMITLIVVALSYLKVFGTKQQEDARYLISYGLKAILYLSAFFVLVYYAAKVNKQFQEHRNIIKANKQVAIVLFSQYSDFIGENAIEPGTYIYTKGLKHLKKEFGEELTQETKGKMKEELEILIKTYDSVLEELDSEEAQNPIKILGLPITSTVVKSFGTVLVSLSAPVFKTGITYILSLIQSKSTP